MQSRLARAPRASLVASVALLSAAPSVPLAAIVRARNLTANVVALDHPLMWNRLGSQNINGAVFALRRDVVKKVCTTSASGVTTCAPGAVLGAADVAATTAPLNAGKVMLRPDKRPWPLVLRVAAGDCLTVNFTNLLAPPPAGPNPYRPVLVAENTVFNLLIDDQVADRNAGFHVQGMQLVDAIGSDASFVGLNASSLAAPGQTRVYKLFAEKEGAFLATSHGATFGSDGSAGNSANGLFGQVDAMPAGSRIYRSDVTEEEFRLAVASRTADGFPLLNYEATYPATNPGGTASVWVAERPGGRPALLAQRRRAGPSRRRTVTAGVAPEEPHPPFALRARPGSGATLASCRPPGPRAVRSRR